MARKKIIAGNWKMNLTPQEGVALVNGILGANVSLPAHKEVVIAPSFINLPAVQPLLDSKTGFALAAQDCHYKTSGAFTGDVSVGMIQAVGCKYVIIGHSERREYHHESDAILAEKVNTALEAGLQVIFCCGEPLSIREAEEHNAFVTQQIKNSLFHLSAEQLKNVVVAYEPIWAIGTGKTASSEQAQDMHANIRAAFADKYGNDVAEGISILYGGSCSPKNAAELFSQKDIDGGLIGGASLKAEDFVAVINAMN
jgi:triosephosphate isomerase